jgi:hypothetical protein
LKFDFSMIKGMPNSRASQTVSAPMSVERPRFELPADSYPVRLEQPLPLLDFITWCVPDDGSPNLGAIGRLYASLAITEESVPSPPAMR